MSTGWPSFNFQTLNIFEMFSVACDYNSLVCHCSGCNQCIHLTRGLTQISKFTFYSSKNLSAFKIKRNYLNNI